MAFILNKNDKSVSKVARLNGSVNKINDNMIVLDFTEIFTNIVTKSLFTLTQKVNIGGLNVTTRNPIYEIKEDEVIPFYKFMTDNQLSPYLRNQIIDLLCELWDKNEDFKISTYNYYLSENLKELEQDLKIFKNYQNPVEINSVWGYYRFKLNEMYNPLKNFIINCYPYQVYSTSNPLYFYLEKDYRLRYVMFDDALYMPNKLGAYYRIPLF